MEELSVLPGTGLAVNAQTGSALWGELGLEPPIADGEHTVNAQAFTGAEQVLCGLLPLLQGQVGSEDAGNAAALDHRQAVCTAKHTFLRAAGAQGRLTGGIHQVAHCIIESCHSSRLLPIQIH